VLPLRFGTVMAAKDAVAGELLAVYQEAFAAALTEVESRAQYVETRPQCDGAMRWCHRPPARAVEPGISRLTSRATGRALLARRTRSPRARTASAAPVPRTMTSPIRTRQPINMTARITRALSSTA
jgi:hypothetical protein